MNAAYTPTLQSLQLYREAHIHDEHSVADLPNVSSVWEPGLGGSSASMAKVLVDTVSGRRGEEELKEDSVRWMVCPSLSLSQALGEVLWEHSFTRTLSALLPLVLLNAH